MGKKYRTKVQAPFFQPLGKAETPDTTAVTVLLKDSANKVLVATGTTVPSDAETGYAKGCIFIDTDVGAGSSGFYENVGTNTSCNFDVIGGGGGGSTTFTGLTDTPASFAAAGDKIVKVNTGATALEFVTPSGDATMDASGSFTVTDLTIAAEAQGDLLYNDGSGWESLAAGTNGYILKTQGAGANPVWVDPASLPMGTATKLSQNFDIEGGTNDITVAVTTQTVGAPTVTFPDLAGAAQTFVFTALAQTLTNKTLTSPVLTTPQINDTSADHQYIWAVNELAADRTITLPLLGADDVFVFEAFTQTLTNKTLSGNVATGFVYSAGGNAITFQNAIHTVVGRDTTDTLTNKTLTGNTMASFSPDGIETLTMPVATDTLVGKATTDTFTNKTFDCDAAGNVLSNVNADELDPITTGSSTYALPFVVTYSLSNQAGAVNIFNANAPFKLKVIKAWSVSTSADGGTWKLNNGAAGGGTDITNAVTVGASADDFDEPTDYTDSASTIASGGSLSVVPDGAGLLDCEIYVMAIRVN